VTVLSLLATATFLTSNQHKNYLQTLAKQFLPFSSFFVLFFKLFVTRGTLSQNLSYFERVK